MFMLSYGDRKFQNKETFIVNDKPIEVLDSTDEHTSSDDEEENVNPAVINYRQPMGGANTTPPVLGLVLMVAIKNAFIFFEKFITELIIKP